MHLTVKKLSRLFLIFGILSAVLAVPVLTLVNDDSLLGFYYFRHRHCLLAYFAIQGLLILKPIVFFILARVMHNAAWVTLREDAVTDRKFSKLEK